MKLLITTLFAVFFISLFTQCKKNNSPHPTDDHDHMAPGNYIIRTKYMCADGRAFVLGSFSNHEVLGWGSFTPEGIKGIKDDKPYTSNAYVWTVGESRGSSGIGIEDPSPDPSWGVIGARYVFGLYQKTEDGTYWYLTSPEGSSSDEDHTGFGIGGSFLANVSGASNGDFSNILSSLSYFSVTDSTGRLNSYAQPYRWYLSLPTDPDDVCDDFNSAVIWRNDWLCPNTTVIGNAWKFDACAISQLVFEKVD